MKVTAKEGQCLVDIAIQTLGTVEGVLSLAMRNGLRLTETLPQGTVLEYDLSEIEDRRVVEAYRREGVLPATAPENGLVERLLTKPTEKPESGGADPIEPEEPDMYTNVFDTPFDKTFC